MDEGAGKISSTEPTYGKKGKDAFPTKYEGEGGKKKSERPAEDPRGEKLTFSVVRKTHSSPKKKKGKKDAARLIGRGKKILEKRRRRVLVQ